MPCSTPSPTATSPPPPGGCGNKNRRNNRRKNRREEKRSEQILLTDTWQEFNIRLVSCARRRRECEGAHWKSRPHTYHRPYSPPSSPLVRVALPGSDRYKKTLRTIVVLAEPCCGFALIALRRSMRKAAVSISGDPRTTMDPVGCVSRRGAYLFRAALEQHLSHPLS
jgi:hypothetical protein